MIINKEKLRRIKHLIGMLALFLALLSVSQDNTVRSFAAFDPVIVAAGDIVCGTADQGKDYPCKDLATAKIIAAINPQYVLVLGDNQYESGSLSDYNTYYSRTGSWGQFKAKTYPVSGNHEYITSNASGYFSYFGSRAGTQGKGYYSFDVGSWHMIALNSNCDKLNGGHGCDVGSPQEQWLKANLAAHTNGCTLAFMHHAFYTSGNKDMPALKPLIQDLYSYNADLMLVGHKHMYERFAPQNPSAASDPAKGIREIVVGTGGKDLTGVGNTLYPNLQIRNGQTFGVLKLTLHPTSYDWQFVPITGSTFTDSGSYTCH